MAKRNVTQLVLIVLRAVYAKTRDKPTPYYVSVAGLGVAPDDPESVDAAISLAFLSGWLLAGTSPPSSVAITSAGIRLLHDQGLM